jgi:hypothetical protein
MQQSWPSHASLSVRSVHPTRPHETTTIQSIRYNRKYVSNNNGRAVTSKPSFVVSFVSMIISRTQLSHDQPCRPCPATLDPPTMATMLHDALTVVIVPNTNNHTPIPIFRLATIRINTSARLKWGLRSDISDICIRDCETTECCTYSTSYNVAGFFISPPNI